MILFLFLILIILVCIYKNHFSNQEGNTIYVKNCNNNEYIGTDGTCKNLNTVGAERCLEHYNKNTTDINSSRGHTKNILDKIGNFSTINNCVLNLPDEDFNNIPASLDVNKDLISSTKTNNPVSCKEATDGNNKKIKGNLYCKYNGAKDPEIIGDISCVDVSDFKDGNWYRNVKNVSFEYTNDGSRDKLHYICKTGTSINGDGAAEGIILASNWGSDKGSKKCDECPNNGHFYNSKCNTDPARSNPTYTDVNHLEPECEGEWLQVANCTKLPTAEKATFKAKFIYKQGKGIPPGNIDGNTCVEQVAPKGVSLDDGDYIKFFDCDTTCGKWTSGGDNVGCGSEFTKYKYDYKSDITNIKKNQCYFEAPRYPGVENCFSTKPNDETSPISFAPPTSIAATAAATTGPGEEQQEQGATGAAAIATTALPSFIEIDNENCNYYGLEQPTCEIEDGRKIDCTECEEYATDNGIPMFPTRYNFGNRPGKCIKNTSNKIYINMRVNLDNKCSDELACICKVPNNFNIDGADTYIKNLLSQG